MPATIHILCEAESANARPNEQIDNPSITDSGILQSQNVRDNFPHFNQVRAIFSSPSRRAVQTAQIAFEPLLNQSMQITLRRDLQGLPYTTRSWEELRVESGISLDLRDLQAGLGHEGVSEVISYDPSSISALWDNFGHQLAVSQARIVRNEIRDAVREFGDNDHVVVVAGRLFIGYLLEGTLLPFADGEYRSYQFRDRFDDQALLVSVESQNGSVSNWSEEVLVGEPLSPIATPSSNSGSSSHSSRRSI